MEDVITNEYQGLLLKQQQTIQQLQLQLQQQKMTEQRLAASEEQVKALSMELDLYKQGTTEDQLTIKQQNNDLSDTVHKQQQEIDLLKQTIATKDEQIQQLNNSITSTKTGMTNEIQKLKLKQLQDQYINRKAIMRVAGNQVH